MILDGLTVSIDEGETLVLLGRSGSGKTTALRLINRMVELTSGSIWLDGRDITKEEPVALRRRIGYVIQEIGLLPHWTVSENVGLVLRLNGVPDEEQSRRAAELLDQVGLPAADYARRYPRELSGGQRQRVGVARALAAEPSLLLFDEPFGALDPITRHEMQLQFIALRQKYKTTAVFVTHDLAEALVLGTRIAVLEKGRLEMVATPREFLDAQSPVARAFLETVPHLKGLL